MNQILVTGAAGFIGSHLAEALLKKGYSVLAIDNFSNGKKENIEYLHSLGFKDSFSFLEGDLRDNEFCNDICNSVNIVYHQAALGSVPRSIKEPMLYFENNLGGMINLLEACRKNKVKRFIFASSSSVYGDTPTLPKVESMSLNPKSPYALSKLSGEKYLRVYQDVYGIETIGFRYFNVFGPRQDPNSQYAAVIPKFFNQCFSNQDITINGDGNQTRDFTYVDNVVQFNLKALNSPIEATNKIYNVGCGEQISVLNLAKQIRVITNSSTNISFNEGRPGDVRDSLACIELGEKLLNVEDLVFLKDGLQKTNNWFNTFISFK